MREGQEDRLDRPRVLIFRNELLPQSETFIRAQAEALQKFEPVYVGVHPALRSMSLPSTPHFISPKETLIGKLRRRLYWATGYAPGLSRKLLPLHPSLIHAHFAIDGAAALPLADRLQCPLIITLHGYDVSSSEAALRRTPEGRLYLRRREQLWERASTFLCISDFIRQQALAQGFPAHKLRLLYTGIDLSLFEPKLQQRDSQLVLFVGRLVEKKGGRHLLAAMQQVRRKLPKAHLVMIGAGPEEQRLRALAEELGVPTSFLGAQAPQVVSEYLARARVFCVPSVKAANGDSEGLGMVFAEAQAMGTPVVSFRHGGIPEVVSHEYTGLLATEGNTAELAEYVSRLLQDDTLWADYSSNGIGMVQERFSLRKQVSALEDLYARHVEQ